MSEEKFQKLETEVRQLIKVSQQLKEVNEDLSTKNSTLRKENRDLEEYRTKYLKKTGQPWQKATIQDIYKAELVWGF